jgi:hypothetical protein
VTLQILLEELEEINICAKAADEEHQLHGQLRYFGWYLQTLALSSDIHDLVVNEI